MMKGGAPPLLRLVWEEGGKKGCGPRLRGGGPNPAIRPLATSCGRKFRRGWSRHPVLLFLEFGHLPIRSWLSLQIVISEARTFEQGWTRQKQNRPTEAGRGIGFGHHDFLQLIVANYSDVNSISSLALKGSEEKREKHSCENDSIST